jgi:uncharacterized protein (TIGR02246 family)
MKRFATLVGLGVALLLASGARADLKAEIETQNAAFRSAFLAGDADKVAALYSADAQVVAPGAPIASGRAAIAAFWKGAMAGVKDVQLATRAVESQGDLAVEDGTATLTAPDGKQASSRYVVVWKRAQGKWQLHRDIWNEGK